MSILQRRPGRRDQRGARFALLLVASIDLAACSQPNRNEIMHGGGDAARGKVAIETYGCGACHSIPGIAGARGQVGPPLDHWSRRVYIAGEVPNTEDFLIRWIEVPEAIEPKTAMPMLGVTEGSARDIAAYLYSIR
jgi:cytochrome c2